MSLHTQLLRGMVVLPMLLLLAVASLTSPGARAAHARAEAHGRAATLVVVADEGGRVIVVSPAAR